ncbi:MAG: MFS transporter [Gammaproteobacteria bacterium]|nr:MFS transporter [Gammaproteobacteria bacterium]
MQRLWLILVTLTLARMTMGFQFQSIAAVGPRLTDEAILTHTELGTLIGLYLLPGALFALPGGWLGQRFGDKRIVLAGLAMMTLGGAALALSELYPVMFGGRLLAGLGAVLLNVLLTKMVTDWFVGRRIATAMGVLISSWPLGIALALVIIGPLSDVIGLRWAFFVPVALSTLALLLVALVYTSPPGNEDIDPPAGPPTPARLSRAELQGAVLSGCVWALYNVALILPLSFGAEYLVTRGFELGAAGATVSLASWLIIPALPLGAWVAERIGRPVATMVVSFLAIAVLLWTIPLTSAYVLLFIAIGLVFGPAGGLIMALPAQVLGPTNRALGMGIFFTMYYLGMGIFPMIAGYSIDLTGSPAAPLVLGGIAIMLALIALLAFQLVKQKQEKAGAASR